jgi:hypothetical protein
MCFSCVGMSTSGPHHVLAVPLHVRVMCPSCVFMCLYKSLTPSSFSQGYHDISTTIPNNKSPMPLQTISHGTPNNIPRCSKQYPAALQSRAQCPPYLKQQPTVSHGIPNHIPQHSRQCPTVPQTISHGPPNNIPRYSDRAHAAPRYSKQYARYPTVLPITASPFVFGELLKTEGAPPYIYIYIYVYIYIYICVYMYNWSWIYSFPR